jgi:hypothetical protein
VGPFGFPLNPSIKIERLHFTPSLTLFLERNNTFLFPFSILNKNLKVAYALVLNPSEKSKLVWIAGNKE